MAIGSVSVNKQQGVGQPTSGKDHYTGMVFYVDQASEYPAGIMKPYAAAAFAVGEILEHTDYKVYRVLTTNALTGTPATDVGAGDVEEITDAEDLADARTAQVTVANMDTLGITEGSGADKIWYVMNQFFQKNPNGFAWIRVADEGLSTTNFDELDDLVTVSDGEVRKIGVYNNGNNSANFAVSQVTALQAKYTEYYNGKTPVNIAYFPIGYGETYDNFIDLTDSGSSFGVSVYNAFDYVKNDADYPAMGPIMGYWADSKVSESIGYVRKFNMVCLPTGTNTNEEFDKFGLLDSSGLISWGTLKGAAADLLDDKGWNIFVKYVGRTGSYVNDMYTVAETGTNSDKAFFDTTLNKISRLVREALLPEINSEVQFNADGTLQDKDVDRFTDLAQEPIDVMIAASELSAGEAIIDRTQDVASTSTLSVTVNVVLNNVTKTIEVNLARVNAIG